MMRIAQRTEPVRPVQGWAWWRVVLAVLSLAALGVGSQPGGPQPTAVPAFRQADRVAIIPIEGPIDRITAFSVKRRMDLAIAGGAQAIVFEINTPGGEVPAVLEICSTIKASSVPNTVAWVHPQAYSGGAIIALACREIVVSDSAMMGDALPIVIGPGGVDVATQGELRKKQVPPVLAEVVDSARVRGWDEFIVQAIVIDRVELWWIEEITADGSPGRKLAVNEQEFRMLFPGQEPPRGAPGITAASIEGLSGMTPETSESEAAPSAPPSDTAFRPAVPALEDLSPGLSGGSDAASVPDLDMLASVSSRPVLTPADAGKWRVARYLTNGSGPIVMTRQDMQDYGFATRTINSDAELKAHFGAKELVRIRPTWTESVVTALSNMWVRMLLIAVFLLALFIEMVSPGLMVPGLVAGVSLMLVLAPAWMLGLAGWWEAIAIVSGVGLILLEIFVIPGFGVAGFAGLSLLFTGLVMSFVGASGGLFPSSTAGQADLTRSAVTVLIALATAGGGIFVVSKYFGSLPVLGRLVLDGSREDEAESGEIDLAEAMGPAEGLAALVGKTGVAHSPLRPSGRVEVEGRLYDGLSRLGYVDAGTAVLVTGTEGWSVVVEEAGGSA